MPTVQSRSLPVLLASMAFLAACSFGSPPSCGEDIGGTADSAKFDQRFASMTLVSEATGEIGPEGEGGMQLTAGEPLAIQIESKAEVEVRACIQPIGGSKEIPFDQTQSISQGSSSFGIGSFDPGKYVIRVIVDGTLVKNFPFTAQ